MVRTPEKKERFHKIMAEINEAYNNKNLHKMEEVAVRLKSPETEFLEETIEKELEKLLRKSKNLDNIILRLKDELKVIKTVILINLR